MHSSELAPNVDAITRDYINLIQQEALTASLTEVWAAIEAINAKPAPTIDMEGIELRAQKAVVDSLTADFADLIDRKFASAQSDLAQTTADIMSSLGELQDTCRLLQTRIAQHTSQLADLLARPTVINAEIDMTPINALTRRVETIEATPAPTLDTAKLQSDTATSVIDQLSAAMAKLVQDNIAALQAKTDLALDDIRLELERFHDEDSHIRQLVDALDLKIKNWSAADRYSITRAQVLKAMRESSANV